MKSMDQFLMFLNRKVSGEKGGEGAPCKLDTKIRSKEAKLGLSSKLYQVRIPIKGLKCNLHTRLF